MLFDIPFYSHISPKHIVINSQMSVLRSLVLIQAAAADAAAETSDRTSIDKQIKQQRAAERGLPLNRLQSPAAAVRLNLFAFVLLRQFAFRKLAIVWGDTVPALQPSSQQVNLSESTSLLSCSSLLNLHITSSPCISE